MDGKYIYDDDDDDDDDDDEDDTMFKTIAIGCISLLLALVTPCAGGYPGPGHVQFYRAARGYPGPGHVKFYHAAGGVMMMMLGVVTCRMNPKF